MTQESKNIIINLISKNPWKYHDEMMEIFMKKGVSIQELKEFYKNDHAMIEYIENIKEKYIKL